MIKIIITNKLKQEIFKKFRNDSIKVFKLMNSLKKSPTKGKTVLKIGDIILKELKYKVFRFYFIFEGHKLILFNESSINELLFRFIEMSKKNNQQEIIDKIKIVIRKLKK
jgi:hypothetical protein